MKCIYFFALFLFCFLSLCLLFFFFFFFSSRRRHTRCGRDWSSDVCSSDLRLPDRPDEFGHAHDQLKITDLPPRPCFVPAARLRGRRPLRLPSAHSDRKSVV